MCNFKYNGNSRFVEKMKKKTFLVADGNKIINSLLNKKNYTDSEIWNQGSIFGIINEQFNWIINNKYYDGL